MSLVPVTSHPRFDAAGASFKDALPALNPTTRFATSIPTEAKMRFAVDQLRTGIETLTPMTAKTTLWLHQPANAAIGAAKQAIELLQAPIAAVASGAVTPETGSTETADAIAQARQVIARAGAATIL